MRGTTLLLLSVVMVATCTAPAAPPASPGPGSTAPPASGSVGPELTRSPAPTASGLGERPPAGRLQAEGGDPVTGQLGTYTWGDGGSDSPWVTGAAIAVGAGEPLSVSFDPPVEVASWRARFVPSSANGPEGGASLGEGRGVASFAAPSTGSWTVEVNVTFASDHGGASYFWRLEVS